MLLLLVQTPPHEMAVFYVFATCFGLDTAAYFAGRRFGGPSFAPKISPNKTMGGAIGGLCGVVVLALIFKGIHLSLGDASSHLWWNIGAQLNAGELVMLGLSLGVVGQLGDLLESAFKRWGQVKDSGSLLLGHGGFLDRFDSLFLAAPLCYLLLYHFLHLGR